MQPFILNCKKIMLFYKDGQMEDTLKVAGPFSARSDAATKAGNLVMQGAYQLTVVEDFDSERVTPTAEQIKNATYFLVFDNEENKLFFDDFKIREFVRT